MAFYHQGLRGLSNKLTPGHLVDAVKAAMSDDTILLDWVNRGPVQDNWGDAIAPIIGQRLSGKRVVNQRDVLNVGNKTVYTGIGSMLGSIDARNVVVWGSGFVHTNGTLQCTPKRICAVRGPLSRQKLIGFGVDCPELYGDPALLFPYIYRPTVEKKYKLGIVPHWKDFHLPIVEKLRQWDDVLVIDLMSGIEKVVDDINSCERIASSSLHALVAADGYEVPAIWVMLSDRPAGDGFKFRDYLDSTETRRRDPLWVDESTVIDQIFDEFDDETSTLDLDAFLDACPFLDRDYFERTKR